MSTTRIQLNYDADFRGTLRSDRVNVAVGSVDGGLYPYEMLLGALGSCLYHTLLDIIQKKRLPLSDAQLDLEGVKRQSVPATLEKVQIHLTLKGTDTNRTAEYQHSLDLACQYCSVHETVRQVAEITTTLSIE